VVGGHESVPNDVLYPLETSVDRGNEWEGRGYCSFSKTANRKAKSLQLAGWNRSNKEAEVSEEESEIGRVAWVKYLLRLPARPRVDVGIGRWLSPVFSPWPYPSCVLAKSFACGTSALRAGKPKNAFGRGRKPYCQS